MSSKQLTVLFADLVGSTKLSMKLNSDSDYRLKSILREEFEQRLDEYNGVFRQALGDAFVISFEDATQAVRYSIAVQQAVQTLDFDELNESIYFRMGLHTGKVTTDQDGNIHGPVLKIAEGVEGRSRPDEIFLTSATYRNLDRDAVNLDMLGERSVKGADEEIALFRVIYEKQRSNQGLITTEKLTSMFSSTGILVGAVCGLALLVIVVFGVVFLGGDLTILESRDNDDQFESRVTSYTQRQLKMFGRPSAPGEYEGLLVTRLFNDGSDEFIELFNPTADTQYLLYLRETSPGIDLQLNKTVQDLTPIPPCEYVLNVDNPNGTLFEHINVSDDNNDGLYDYSMDSSLGSAEGVRVTSMSPSDTGFIYDAVGWTKGEDKTLDFFKEGRLIQAGGNSFYLKRKRDERGFPIDTNDNRSDFEVDTGIPSPKTGFSAPGCDTDS